MSKAAIRFALLVVACCLPPVSAGAGITRTWTGTVSTLFSEPNNWSPAGVPASDDSLVFPADATLDNDLPPGTKFGPMEFDGSVTLNGNAMTLTGNWTINTEMLFTCNADLVIGAGLRLGNGGRWVRNGYWSMWVELHGPQSYGSIDVNGQTLRLNGYTTVKSLNGAGSVSMYSGSLTVLQGSLTVLQDSTFQGEIGSSVDIRASMPNGNVTGNVIGDGALGRVNAFFVSPGETGGNPIGILKTGSLRIWYQRGYCYAFGVEVTGISAAFDLDATGVSDSIEVTGTVSLDNYPRLSVRLSGVPTPGQTFKLIDNDGTDPVSGTFDGLPEGSTINLNGYDFIVSYHGGDGNDVVLTMSTLTKMWYGSVNDLWSNPGNWVPNAIPVSGETLMFPTGGTMTNDLPAGFAVGRLRFTNGFATLNGNPLTLTGDVTVVGRTTALACNAELKLADAVALAGDDNEHYAAIDVNGQTLTFASPAGEWTWVGSLNGSGTVIPGRLIVIENGGTFNGTIYGSIAFHGSMPNANVAYRPIPGRTFWPEVVGDGALGMVEAGSLSFGWWGPPCSGRTLKTRSLWLNQERGGWSSITFDLYSSGVFDQIQVTGTVTLDSNPHLNVLAPCDIPAVTFGLHFVLIDNDGTDPVSGTFAGLPEGAAVTASWPTVPRAVFRITYAGGDGNDVELFVATTPSAALSQKADNSVIGEPVALTATVSSGLGVPAGTVTFFDNGVAIGTAPLSNGTATLNVSALSLGSHTITATYPGGGAFFGALSGPMTHAVAKGDTTTSITPLHTPSMFGAAQFRISSTPRAPAAGTVAGTFTLREGKKVLGEGSIDAGSGHIFLATLPVGRHTFVASYSGSANFKESDSGPFVVEVTEAPTQVTATRDDSGLATDGTVALKIFVLPTTSAPLIVTGTITISENGVVLSEQPTTGALDVTLRLAGGHHLLSISYSGDANFLASSTDLEVDVKATAPVKRRAVRH